MPQIHAFLKTGITNARSEDTNRVIKTVSRDAYGFRNPENQRLRTRTAITPPLQRTPTAFRRTPGVMYIHLSVATSP